MKPANTPKLSTNDLIERGVLFRVPVDGVPPQYLTTREYVVHSLTAGVSLVPIYQVRVSETGAVRVMDANGCGRTYESMDTPYLVDLFKLVEE